MKRKTLIRRKDIDCLFDRTEDYQARIGKIHEKREYDTVYQIVASFIRCDVQYGIVVKSMV